MSCQFLICQHSSHKILQGTANAFEKSNVVGRGASGFPSAGKLVQVGEDVVASDDALRKGMSRSQSTAKAMIKIASGKNPTPKGTYTLTFADTLVHCNTVPRQRLSCSEVAGWPRRFH